MKPMSWLGMLWYKLKLMPTRIRVWWKRLFLPHMQYQIVIFDNDLDQWGGEFDASLMEFLSRIAQAMPPSSAMEVLHVPPRKRKRGVR